MKIVILDGYTVNPGDLDWAQIEALGELTVYDRTPPEQTVERARDASAVLTNKVVFDRPVLDALPDLRYIGVLATGYNVVDIPAARERGIVVTNIPAYATEPVAQFTFALLLELCHHVGAHSDGAREGRWSQSPDFAYWDFPLVELQGLTMGLVGLGRIGQAVARIARAFGMRAIASTRSGSTIEGIESVDLDTLLRTSDVVSLHCPLTDATRHLINAQRLAMMKPSAFLINTGRGPLIDEPALASALSAGRLAGAAVDVLSTEPPAPDNPLLTARNCLVTPHIAWATRSARARLLATAAANLRAFAAGTPQNVVG